MIVLGCILQGVLGVVSDKMYNPDRRGVRNSLIFAFAVIPLVLNVKYFEKWGAA